MADIVDKATRSRMMAGIRGKNTKPEMIVRRFLHSQGLRYRLHVKDLPGKPDLVFTKYRTVVFVHGCFWHGHQCGLFKFPQTRVEFWREKLTSNMARDRANRHLLEGMGWRVLEVYECELRDEPELTLTRVATLIRQNHGR